ncbi:hypothetical protein INT47_010978 [Mucor saturninus]|uniref:Uncharacterized protein n=1 Tax=Mucor saturninus TaxID=64648 RepID=A0A8H7UX35_9FUNG|nr:hypothetical protein INT47_010978 [Mucor saturninus]
MVEVEGLETAGICYRSNPTEPELVYEARIFGAPSLYNLYKSKEEIEKDPEENDKNKDEKRDILFCNDAQIVHFINYLFRPPLIIVCYNNKQNIDFLSEEPERKLVKGDTGDEKIRRRHLNVLNSVYYGKARKWHRK